MECLQQEQGSVSKAQNKRPTLGQRPYGWLERWVLVLPPWRALSRKAILREMVPLGDATFLFAS